MKLIDGDVRDRYDIESHSFLQLNGCGITMPVDDFHYIRRNGRSDYHIVYVTQGRCGVEYMGKNEIIKQGDFFLYPPHIPQDYIKFKDSKSIWLHFNGYEVDNILKENRLAGGVYHKYFSPNIEQLFIQLMNEYHKHLVVSNEKGLLLSIICELSKLINSDDEQTPQYYSGFSSNLPNNVMSKVNECARFIVYNYNIDISVKDLADSCNLSQSRFIFLFKKITGTTPHAYQQNIRINNSKIMLSSTSHTIAEISRFLGYDDPLYFSRLFKKKTGLSPVQFRSMKSETS